MLSHWESRLLHRGQRQLGALGDTVRCADPDGLIAPRSALLCCALSELALCVYRALGGEAHAQEVAQTASLLSLLTKLDDQIIDSLSFHGGAGVDREILARKTSDFLAPTLTSIVEAQPAEPAPRCLLAAALGQQLRVLTANHPERLADIIAQVAQGWAIQVEAVVCLSADPSQLSEARIDRATTQISGAWLMMIAAIGTLPRDAHRLFTVSERQAFWGWGRWIQRADALADYSKDMADGHISSWPNFLMAKRSDHAWRDAVARSDADALFALLAETQADRACLPPGGELESLERELAELGELASLLRWIQAFLWGRYLHHPMCRRDRHQAPWADLADLASLHLAQEDADVRHPAA